MRDRSNTLRVIIAAAVVAGMLTRGDFARADTDQAEVCANAAEEAQSLRSQSKLTAARNKLLVCVRSVCPAFVKSDCTKWLAELEGAIPSVVVRAVDEQGRDLSSVSVSIDGQAVASKLDGRPIALDPGEHAFKFESEGSDPVAQNVIIRQGETNRILSVTLKGRAPGLAPGIASPAGGSKIPTAAWVVGGAGVIALGVGAVLWASGTSDHGDLESGCARTGKCPRSEVDSARTKLLIGDVAFGAGIVALGAAVVIAIIVRDPAAASSTQAARFDMRPLHGGGAVGSFSARF